MCAGRVALTARAAMAIAPFRHVVRWLGTTEAASVSADSAAAKRVGWALAVAAGRLPLGSSCLVRAIARKLMLDRRGIPCTVVLGVRAPAKDFAAHAWLHAGDLIVSGAGGATDYSELARFQ